MFALGIPALPKRPSTLDKVRRFRHATPANAFLIALTLLSALPAHGNLLVTDPVARSKLMSSPPQRQPDAPDPILFGQLVLKDTSLPWQIHEYVIKLLEDADYEVERKGIWSALRALRPAWLTPTVIERIENYAAIAHMPLK